MWDRLRSLEPVGGPASVVKLDLPAVGFVFVFVFVFSVTGYVISLP